MTNVMHKFLIHLSIYFCLTCFELSFSPSSEAGVQFRQWFKSPGYGPYNIKNYFSSWMYLWWYFRSQIFEICRRFRNLSTQICLRLSTQFWPRNTDIYILFFDAFTKWRKATISFVRYVFLSVRMDQFSSNFHKIWHLNIFRKSVENIQVSLKSDKKNGFFT
jgi:hypothetical protein